MESYFCRGCGNPLAPGQARAQFHPECLKADKARRVRETREREERAFGNRLSRLRCPHCGERYAAVKQAPDGAEECSCEASQGRSETPMARTQ